MRNNHKVFIKEYVTNGFNGSLAYRTAYNISKDTAYCNDRAVRLLKREDIRNAIESKVDELSSISEGEYLLQTKLLHEKETNPSVKARYWELLGKVKQFTSDNTTQQVVNLIDYSKLQKNMTSKQSSKVSRGTL